MGYDAAKTILLVEDEALITLAEKRTLEDHYPVKDETGRTVRIVIYATDDTERRRSLGEGRLVGMLAQQAGGSIRIERGAGARFVLERSV